MMDTQKQAPLAQRSLERLHFNHKDMDYYLSWITGRHVFDGSDPDECMQTATKIIDGDPASWQREWKAMAEQVEGEAKSALQRGELELARGAFLRACTYYRAPLFIMGPEDPRFKENWRKMQECFRTAMKLFDFPFEVIQVHYQGAELDGYAWKVDQSSQKRSTLLVVGGMETFAEDCFFMVGTAPLERGYNVLAVDLPGQGMNPEQGLILQARMGLPVKAVIDHALSLPDVDPGRFALFGFSWGGHIVLQGAQDEKRLRALIANPPMPDVFRAARAQQSGNGRGDPVARQVFAQIAWRFGAKIKWELKPILKRFGMAFDYFAHGKADCKRIHCATLCMAGEGEAPITHQMAKKCFAELPHPQKKLVILTKAEGGEAHCQVNNLPLLNRVVFDWLDEVN
jgi:pimeloyl-ACP methyl ester carboxylesterase